MSDKTRVKTSQVKHIRIKNEIEFERLRDRIDLEVSHARHHWSLLKGLEEARTEYHVEMNESSTFWHLTFIAHRDAVVAHLGRLYDKHKGALSLTRFLATVKANPGLFSFEAFQKRLKDNSHAESLALTRALSNADLDAELTSVSESEPLVSKLWKIRDSTIAHTDADKIKRDAPEAHRRWLPPNEIETLLNKASAITSKYSLSFRASFYGGIAGADDYKSTLQWVRRALSSHRDEIEKEMEQIRRAKTT